MTRPGDQGEPTQFADRTLLRRVQQENQEQIIRKLMHDLRNPVHSVRIAVELFSRLVHQQGEIAAMLARAGRYVVPAQAAVDSLSKQTERLALYLQAPAPPDLKPVSVNEWCADLVLLLQDATRPLHLEANATLTADARVVADLARLSHAVLRWALSRVSEPALITTSEDGDRISIELVHAPMDAGAPSSSVELSVEDLTTLIEGAGGVVVEATPVRMRLSFSRVG